MKKKQKEKSFFATQLEKAMFEKKITQKRLSEIIGNSQARISGWLHGVRNPSLTSIKKIASALDLPINFFVENSGNTQTGNNNIIGNSNNFNANMKDIKIQLQDHEIRLLKLENELLRKELKR